MPVGEEGAANPCPHVASYTSRVDRVILNQQSDKAEQLLMLWTPARAQECPDLDVSDMASGGDVSLVANENLP